MSRVSSAARAVGARMVWLNDGLVLLGCLGLVAALRFTSLFALELNPDDSLYLLAGRSLLRGELPYTAVWDHHPVGGRVLFALAELLFGSSVSAIRLLTIAAVAAQCFLVYKLGSRLGRGDPLGGWAAAVAYALFSNSNLSADRILFFAPLITLALCLLLVREDEKPIGRLRLVLAGLPLALGAQLKYTLGLELLSVAVIVTLEVWRLTERRRFVGRALEACMLLALFPVLVFIGVAGGFAVSGHWSEFVYANFIASARYAEITTWSLGRAVRASIVNFNMNALLWVSAAAAPLYALAARNVDPRERRHLLYAGIWLLFAFVGVALTKRFDGHYFLQLLPALSLLLGLLAAGLLQISRQETKLRAVALALILAVSVISTAYTPLAAAGGAIARHFVLGQPWPTDPSAAIAERLRTSAPPGSTIYVVDYSPVIYYASGLDTPSAYSSPVFLIDKWYARIIDRDQMRELDSIMARRPAYVLMQTPPSADFDNVQFRRRLEEYVADLYTLDRVMPGIETRNQRNVNVELYRLKSGGD